MPRRAGKVDHAGRENSLGLTSKKLDAVLDTLDSVTKLGAVQRENARWPFRQPSIRVVLTHPTHADRGATEFPAFGLALDHLRTPCFLSAHRYVCPSAGQRRPHSSLERVSGPVIAPCPKPHRSAGRDR